MPQFDLQAGPVFARIDSTLGAGVCDLSVRSPTGQWTPILRRACAEPESPEDLGCFIMLPWANRIADARFNWNGSVVSLDSNMSDGSAIHGEVRSRPWSIRHRTPQSAILEFDTSNHDDLRFPWDYHARVRYEVSPTGLEIDLSVTNTSDAPGPFGMGLHPYFMRRLWADADMVEVRLPVTGHYPTENCIPTGAPMSDELCTNLSRTSPLAGEALDDLFTVEQFDAEMTWPTSGMRLHMTASREATHAVIYTPKASPEAESPASWFCVEPMTLATNAFNETGDGAIPRGGCKLAPGKSLHLGVDIAFETPSSQF